MTLIETALTSITFNVVAAYIYDVLNGRYSASPVDRAVRETCECFEGQGVIVDQNDLLKILSVDSLVGERNPCRDEKGQFDLNTLVARFASLSTFYMPTEADRTRWIVSILEYLFERVERLALEDPKVGPRVIHKYQHRYRALDAEEHGRISVNLDAVRDMVTETLVRLNDIAERTAARTVELLEDRLTAIERYGRIAAIASSMQRISSFLHPEFTGSGASPSGSGQEFDFKQISHIAGFWRSVLQNSFMLPGRFLNIQQVFETDDVHEGGLVHLKDATVSRWVPLLPGHSFSTSMRPLADEREKWARILEEDACGLEEIAFFENEAKVRSGLASLRLLPRFGEHLLCASGMASWFGVPLVAPNAVYAVKIQPAILSEGALTCDLTAYLEASPGRVG